MPKTTSTKTQLLKLSAVVMAGFMGLAVSYYWYISPTKPFTTLTEVKLPVAPGAREPSLFAMKDGRVLMSWSEPSRDGFAVKTAIGNHSGWTNPQIVVTSKDLYINWADFPSAAAFNDGTLAVHWLMKNGPSTYDYDVNIALSSNDGSAWGRALVPHRDGTIGQHGFVTLLPMASNRLLALWLDARAYDANASGAAHTAFTNASQLRATTISADGTMTQDIPLDIRTCTCCQTSAAVAENGTVLVVYRDRTKDEIRDISILRRVNNVWSKPETIHADDWEISGCPVNGPAIDTHGDKAVVAWYTAANDKPMVNVTFSVDAGESFRDAIRIDDGEADGRVDVLQFEDGSALVSWVELRDEGETLLICRVLAKSGCTNPQIITTNANPNPINFPRMVKTGNGVYIAWTQLGVGKGTVRMVFGQF